MSTKVISAKISSDDYDKLVETCNSKGCSISDFVREQCLGQANPKNDLASKEEKSAQPSEFSEVKELKNKNSVLDLQLRLAQQRVSNLEKWKKEFEELFSSEIINKRICKSADRMKLSCIK